MPDYKTHLVFGFLFVILIFIIFSISTLFDTEWLMISFYIPVIIVFSLLPDLDSGKSIIRRATISLLLLLLVVSILVYYFLKELDYLIPIVLIILIILIIFSTKHRGLMHNVVTGLILALPLVVVDWRVALVAFLAYFSHLVLDLQVF
jgi:membrane-bound metal-dependent hydrolase YbcI (DUF457 family)